MSNKPSLHSDSNRNLRKLPLNIQMAVSLVASVLRRQLERQEQLEAQDKGKVIKQEQTRL